LVSDVQVLATGVEDAHDDATSGFEDVHDDDCAEEPHPSFLAVLFVPTEFHVDVLLFSCCCHEGGSGFF
jgi:hypothetical protein